MHPEVDKYMDSLEDWQSEARLLREILLDCQLTEDFKWRVPCYTYQGKNIAIIAVFKDYCALSFLKGVLLGDEENILESPGENSKSVKMYKFTDISSLHDKQLILKAYLYEAIEIEKAGLKIKPQKASDLVLVEELQNKLESDSAFCSAFNALSAGRQRGYNIYFSAAKQSKSRIARIDKYTERIMNGKGIHDCVCGHSKRMPNCDGSHKYH